MSSPSRMTALGKRKGNSTWVEGDVAYVEIVSPKYGRYVAKVDAHRLDEIKLCTWSVSSASYTKTPRYAQTARPTRVSMHGFLFPDCPEGQVRDHINGDGFDNREENIRFIPHWLNMKNPNNRNRTRLPGVHLDLQSGCFYATLGPFETEEEAHSHWRDYAASLGYLI